MKKVLPLVLLLALACVVSAQAAARMIRSDANLSFHGTKAVCSAEIRGTDAADEIVLIAKLWQGDTCLNNWIASGTGRVVLEKTQRVTKGEPCRLTVDAVVNGAAQSTKEVSGTCPVSAPSEEEGEEEGGTAMYSAYDVHKKNTALAAAVVTGILLSGCGTPGAAVSADGVPQPEARPSVFLMKDAQDGAWKPVGDETASTAGERLYAQAAAQAVAEDLMEAYSYTQEEAETLLTEGGLEVYLCMDAELQAKAETAWAEQREMPSESGEALQSAVALLDSETGQVLALAGDTSALHVPGSALAPLSVYAPALEKGAVTPETAVPDQPLLPEKKWPVNPYGTYSDSVTVTKALAAASSCVPVWILDQKLTVEESAQFVQDRFMLRLVLDRTEGGYAFTDLTPAALALGGLTDGVSTLDMAAAYSVFARGGEYVKPALYSVVMDQNGEALLERNPVQPVRVLKEDTANAVSGMLRETVVNGVGRMAGSAGPEAAGLPGSTVSRKDLWFVGYTPEYTAAVWCGYASHERVAALGNPAAGLWKQVMEGASAGRS